MDEQSLTISNKTIDLAKALYAFAGIVFIAASLFFGMKTDIAAAKDMAQETKQDLIELRIEREKTLDIWRQDRIHQAAFESAVMTKLDRIERKMDR